MDMALSPLPRPLVRLEPFEKFHFPQIATLPGEAGFKYCGGLCIQA